jgi:hypothetical protein
VPIQKCSKFGNTIFKSKIYIPLRSYTIISDNPINDNRINQVKVYENAYDMKKDILKENKGKSGIYTLTNKLTKDIYIGQSVDIFKRFKNYFNLSHIKSRDSYIISRALIKYTKHTRLYTTIITKDSLVPVSQIYHPMNPWFLTGFSDAEACFSINFFKSTNSKFG